MGEHSQGEIEKPPDIEMQVHNNTLNVKENSNDRSNSLPSLEMKYRVTDAGPFQILVEGENRDKGGIARLHPMTIGKLLHDNHPDISENIYQIKKLGRNKVRVELNNAVSANKLLMSDMLKEKGFKAYIPRYLLQRRGIIRGVETDIDDAEIKAVIKFPVGYNMEILEIKRLKRRNVDKESKQVQYVPTQSVLLTVRGQTIPSYVYIHQVSCEVTQYIQRVVQCKKCLKFGHFQDLCKGALTCSKCGDSHDTASCPSADLKCVNCGGFHAATNLTICPRFKKEQTIKNIMATSNISYLDARSYLDGNSFAAIAHKNSPDLEDLNAFPALNKDAKPLTIHIPSTSSFSTRQTKRIRVMSPVRGKENKIDKNLFLAPSVSKNVPGGLISRNPYRPSAPAAAESEITQGNQFNMMIEAVYSIIKKVLSEDSMNDEKLKSVIRNRLKSLQEREGSSI